MFYNQYNIADVLRNASRKQDAYDQHVQTYYWFKRGLERLYPRIPFAIAKLTHKA